MMVKDDFKRSSCRRSLGFFVYGLKEFLARLLELQTRLIIA
jgi:hypothetical protein